MLSSNYMFGFRCDAWVGHLFCTHLPKSKGKGDASLARAVEKGRWELLCEGVKYATFFQEGSGKKI